KMNPPDDFDGSPSKSESFLNSLINIFSAFPISYATDEVRIRYTLGFLKGGSAVKWKDLLLDDVN
ncbi:hypothetical protein CPB84DRAFT_1647696, partial [Gymnopilus junonius]